ncbi:MAG: class I SAM-dependent methyltransferase [Candidatus Entotheonellia bacterium]
MPHVPDLSDPRYRDEVGWFLYYEKHGRDQYGGSYDDERLANSRALLDEVLGHCGQAQAWLHDKTVISIGCGCTGDLSAWPAAVKIAVDPLLYVYQKLGMLVEDAAGTSRTMYVAVGIEDIPLLDACADLVICRNALDHMPRPEEALQQIHRLLKPDGVFFLSVDIGGLPTPDEPTVFSVESLLALLQDYVEILMQDDSYPPHSEYRVCSVRILARKRARAGLTLDKEAVLQAYIGTLGQDGMAEVASQG